jgi:hypothetical protein
VAVVPTMDDWIADEEPTAAKLNANIRDVGNFLLNDRPIAIACRKLTTQTIANNAEVIFDTVLIDTDNMVDLGVSTTRITINTAGYYLLTIGFPYTDDGVGVFRSFRINKNGSEVAANVMPKITGTVATSVTAMKYLSVNDYLEIEIGHDATTFTSRTVNDGPTLTAMWLCS